MIFPSVGISLYECDEHIISRFFFFLTVPIDTYAFVLLTRRKRKPVAKQYAFTNGIKSEVYRSQNAFATLRLTRRKYYPINRRSKIIRGREFDDPAKCPDRCVPRCVLKFQHSTSDRNSSKF